MKKYIKTKKLDLVITKNKKSLPWTGRNETISRHILPNKRVLDLGCGNKDLLNYINPLEYIGVDFNDISDFKINFNEPFSLPILQCRDYIVCSGLLEYLTDLDSFFEELKNNSKIYIFTSWKMVKKIKNPAVKDKNTINEKIYKNFKVISTDSWKKHDIFICEDLL